VEFSFPTLIMPIVVLHDPERWLLRWQPALQPPRRCERQARLRAPEGCAGLWGLIARSCANYTAWRAANLLDESIGHDPIPKSRGRWSGSLTHAVGV